jgi:hypothetical protein
MFLAQMNRWVPHSRHNMNEGAPSFALLAKGGIDGGLHHSPRLPYPTRLCLKCARFRKPAILHP